MARKRTRKGRVYFVARFTFPANPITGERPKPKEFWATTDREARKKRDAFAKEYEKNPKADRVTMFGQYLEQDFLTYDQARYEQGELTYNRLSSRKSRLRRYVLERTESWAKALTNCPLAKLEPETVEDYFKGLLRAGISAGIRHAIRRDLVLVFGTCKRKLSYSVDTFFDSIKAKPEEPKTKLEFDENDILDRIEDGSFSVEARAIVASIFIWNCRPNELFALRWSDIDWKKETVSICRAIREDKGGAREVDYTKTGRKGDRTLPLGSLLTDLLRRLQKERMTTETASEFVFCAEGGMHYDKDSFRYAWRRIRKELKLPDGPTFYSLKTTGNSYALASGVSSRAQADKMGHTSTRMADGAYRKLRSRELVEAVDIYDRKRLNKVG